MPVADHRQRVQAEKPRILSLAEDSPQIADEYAKALACPGIKEPLSEFLSLASHIDGLDGVAMGIHSRSSMSRGFAVYALLDMRHIGTTRRPIGQVSVNVHRAFSSVRRAIQDCDYPIDVSLNLLNSSGVTFDVLAEKIKHGSIEDASGIFSSSDNQLDDVILAHAA